MNYILKPVTSELLNDALLVEKGAMGDYCYLADVYEYFKTTKGELTAAFIDDKMVGIGKFTVLWDGSAWLETLRVDPSWQRKGVGMEIYKRYFEQLKEFDCPSVAMYTGAKNVSSAELARRYALEKAASFREYTLPSSSGDIGNFKQASEDKAVELMKPYFEKYNSYVVMNRTYYKLNANTCKGLASEGRVYYEQNSNSLLVAGARFQSTKGLHIAMLEGDRKACLSCANALAEKQGASRLVCNFALPNIEVEEFLKASEFTAFPEDFITMERKI